MIKIFRIMCSFDQNMVATLCFDHLAVMSTFVMVASKKVWNGDESLVLILIWISCWHFCWLYPRVVYPLFSQYKHLHFILDMVNLLTDCIFYLNLVWYLNHNLKLLWDTLEQFLMALLVTFTTGLILWDKSI